MNSRFLILSLCSLFLFSCDKKESSSDEEQFCYNWKQNSTTDILLSVNEEALVDSLFINNNLSNANLQFFDLSASSLTNTTYVKCHQYVNGLKVFSGDLVYLFDSNGKFEEVFGDVITGINLSNKPAMNPNDLVKTFHDSIKADSQMQGYKSQMLAECVNLEFGYFDENAGGGSASPSYIKAWWLTYDDYGAEMIVNDHSGKTYRYFNGIRTSTK
ncbi:hypothetical protein [Owenweeksia hongkongensis]|uniref:hypothetical protein n=1 Tax=Owenweeksia hongkongensis TaxID=253245 RepID=UPI003A8EB28F